jgi:hypothetical protein
MITRRQFVQASMGATALSLLGHAQAQPVELPKFLYGFPPGSSGDIVARRIAERMAGTDYAKNQAWMPSSRLRPTAPPCACRRSRPPRCIRTSTPGSATTR